MKWAALVACGLAGGIAGAVLLRAVEPAPAPARAATERPAQPAGDGPSYAELARRVAELERDVAGLTGPEPAVASSPRGAAEPPEVAGIEGPAGAAGGAEQPAAGAEELVRRLRGRRLRNEDYGRLFAWLTANKDRTGDVIEGLEREIELDPRNPDLRVALATAHVADLTNNTLPGPQQGLVWMKAAAAYDAALGIEPEHWQARFGKAFGTSMVPEFLGQRPEAIRQFEELLEIQKRRAPEPEFAATYFRLGTLYKDAGNTAKAREVWEAGVVLFPENEELKGALETSTKK